MRRFGQRLSLQARLVIGTVLLLGLGLAVAAVAAVVLIKDYLQQRVDQQLEAPIQAAGTGLPARPAELCRMLTTSSTPVTPLPTSYSFAVLDRGGSVVCRLPVEASELGAPALTTIGDRLTTAAQTRQPLTIPNESRGAPWRVRIAGTENGYVIIGVSLADALDTVRRLQLITAVVTVAILLAVGVGGWFVVRLALSPLTRIERTADAIAGGDLSRRIEDVGADTEVGRLTASLNAMLAQIERGFDERIRAEQRLRRFVADASHELRTPLASIRGHAELYRQGMVTDAAEVAVIMDRIEAESLRMGDLVADLLLLARLDATPTLQRQPVDLLTVAADTVLDARARDPSRTVTVTQLEGAEWLDRPPVVLGDEDGIRQVLGNLVANVLRHTPAGTPYEVAVGVRVEGVELRVVDHGPGLAPSSADRVFERFYREDYGRARSAGGAGLGLSIVVGLMAAHGGSVWHRDTLGGGSTFVVLFGAGSGG